MKLRQILWVTPLLALSLILSACTSSIKEKKEEFGKTVDALQRQGFVLEKKSEGDKSSSYVLKLDQSQKIAAFVLRSAAGSNDPQLSQKLAEAMKGLRLRLEVDWPRYAKAQPKSVAAFLLPGEDNATGEWARLLAEEKIAADLDFDKAGHLKRVSLRPLDETLHDEDQSAHLMIKDTALEILRSGQGLYDQAYRLHSAVMRLSMQEQKGGRLEVAYKGLDCTIDTQDAYFGTRSCRLDRVVMDVLDILKSGSAKSAITLEKIEAKNSTTKQGDAVASQGRIAIAKAVVTQDSPWNKGTTTLSGIELSGRGSEINETVYRHLEDLIANPPADEQIYGAKLLEIFSDLFKKLALGYTLKIEHITADAQSPKRQELTRFDLQGLEFGVDWSLADEFNISKAFTLASARMSRERQGVVEMEAAIRKLALKIRIDKLYNFMPKLMKLVSSQARNPRKASDPQTRKALTDLGAEVLHHGVEVGIDPLTFDSLTLKNAKEKKMLDKVALTLQAELGPNRLDPANPLAPMMALAYLRAEGKLSLSKKDLEQLLPLLDPGMRMMVASFVKYEGDQARFDLRFDQGNLLINGKPLR